MFKFKIVIRIPPEAFVEFVLVLLDANFRLIQTE